MGKARKHTPEQIVNILRQIEVAVANGKTHPVASREAGITEQTYYRWRKEYGGMKVDQAKRLKELEQENSKLKRLVAELSLDKQVLQDIARGNVWSAPVLQAQRCFCHDDHTAAMPNNYKTLQRADTVGMFQGGKPRADGRSAAEPSRALL